MMEMDNVNICELLCNPRNTCLLANGLRRQLDPDSGETVALPSFRVLNRVVVASAEGNNFKNCERPGIYAQAITEVLGENISTEARAARDQLLRRSKKS